MASKPKFRKPKKIKIINKKNALDADADKTSSKGVKDLKSKDKPQDQSWKWVIIAIMSVVLLFFIVPGIIDNTKYQTISYDSFTKALRSDDPSKQIAKAKVDNTTGVITGEFRIVGNAPKEKSRGHYRVNGPVPINEDQVKELQNSGATVNFSPPKTSSIFDAILPFLFPVFIIVLFFVILRKQQQGQVNGMMSIGRSKAKLYNTENPETTFNDVAGYKAAKQEMGEIVDFLKISTQYEEIGAKTPKGVLLVGPPGTGKTLLAKAIAGEAGVPFLSVTGSDFMEMFVGVGASRVRDLFQSARKLAPAIIFIDEIDSIGRKRGAGLGGGHDEREQTLNQLLSEMDGFEEIKGVVLLAATNRPDILDPALLRPGRFDRQIIVPLPDLEDRLPILEVHAKTRKIADDVNLKVVARGTPGMSGADLANLINEAALQAVRRNSTQVHMQDFEAARDRIMIGQRRESLALSEEEKKRIAFHEGGHAILSYVLPEADPLHKVTILPIGMALGVTHHLPMVESHIHTKSRLEDDLAVTMGGRVAELIIYGTYSTGASNDLLVCTGLARKMVREWGMSEKIGPVAWGSQGQVFLGDDLLHSGEKYSPETSHVIDIEIKEILKAAETRARKVLEKHKSGLEKLAAALLEREVLEGEEVANIIDEANGHPVYSEEERKNHFTERLTVVATKAETDSKEQDREESGGLGD